MSDVVVGVDRSETARSAAHTAARLAAAYGVNLHLVTCAEPTASVGVGSEFQSDWIDEAEQFLVGLAHDLPYDRITWNVASGDPAKVIVEEAARLRAGTIVVGNVRTHGVARVLGSVAGAVVRRAPCDVLVAHTS